jgi:adenylate cyclase
MATILVVDDESDLEILIKQKFRKQIREHKYEFVFASNGAQALEKLEQVNNIDLVVSDINMPVMDGLTLLLRLKEKYNLLKSIVVSAYGDMDNIRSAMNRGAFDFLVKPIDFEDLEITIEKTLIQVNILRNTLQAVRENNILKMYVDESVLNFMNSEHAESAIFKNELMEGTVLFIDICGFTSISESRPPNEVVNMLNTYFDIMADEIIKEDGIIDKFIGDAIMATFRGEFHTDRAIDASLAIMRKFTSEHVGDINDGFKPKISIGINSGEMFWGNIGSPKIKRLDYTVIGDAVNIASRIQSAAKPGQILISEFSYNLVKEHFKCESVGAFEFKNKKNPVTVYSVIE